MLSRSVLIGALVLAAVAGCGIAPPLQTRSGRPEVFVLQADGQRLRKIVMAEMMSISELEQESPSVGIPETVYRRG
ncbi:MAG TPA: hypothetical protein VK324_16985 [Tepidisphaeraceae bacterium]|nr:hypothetical protein [Tepidisphaeraceae bacterium]